MQKDLYSEQASAEEIEEGLEMMRNPLEYPILLDINHDRSKEGLSPVAKLTVSVLKAHLRGKLIRGIEWKMGSKKREDLIEDYRQDLQPLTPNLQPDLWPSICIVAHCCMPHFGASISECGQPMSLSKLF